MFRNWIARAAAALRKRPQEVTVDGTRPGFLWWPEGQAWVTEESSYVMNGRHYTLVGPVCRTIDGRL
jgi:hypothetical protein